MILQYITQFLIHIIVTHIKTKKKHLQIRTSCICAQRHVPTNAFLLTTLCSSNLQSTFCTTLHLTPPLLHYTWVFLLFSHGQSRTDKIGAQTHTDCLQGVRWNTGFLKKKGDVFFGPQIQGFTHPVFSQVCIGNWAGDGFTITLSPGLTYQCTLEKTQDV